MRERANNSEYINKNIWYTQVYFIYHAYEFIFISSVCSTSFTERQRMAMFLKCAMDSPVCNHIEQFDSIQFDSICLTVSLWCVRVVHVISTGRITFNTHTYRNIGMPLSDKAKTTLTQFVHILHLFIFLLALKSCFCFCFIICTSFFFSYSILSSRLRV